MELVVLESFACKQEQKVTKKPLSDWQRFYRVFLLKLLNSTLNVSEKFESQKMSYSNSFRNLLFK